MLALAVTRLTAATGAFTLILSFTTCTIPGFVLLLGEWDRVTTGHIWATIVASAAVFVAVAVRTPRAEPAVPATPVDVRVPVSA